MSRVPCVSCSSHRSTWLVEGTIEFIRAEQNVDNLSDRKLHSSLRSSGQNGIDFKIISRGCFDFDCLCASCLRGLELERKQKEALPRLLEGKDVLTVLATRFGKSLIYQSFVLQADLPVAYV